MKIIILCISLACLVLSCDQQSQGSRLSPPATLTALSHRLEAAPHPPLSKEALGAWLATCQLEGFSIKENNTSEFMINGQPVTEGKLVGVNKDGYVAMVITFDFPAC